MKILILAGGFGTRLSEETDVRPKPMIEVGGKPILWHIMKTYAHFGHKDFYLALGYKAEMIKDYFLHYRTLNADFTVDLGDGTVSPHQLDEIDWKVTLVETGLNTMTGGRVRQMKPYIGNETCLLTYGDGVSNVDLDQLIAFHKSHGKMVTVTAVHPGARFGELEMKGEQVSSFQEKPQTGQGWINGGFFVFSIAHLIMGYIKLKREGYFSVEVTTTWVVYTRCIPVKVGIAITNSKWWLFVKYVIYTKRHFSCITYTVRCL